MIYKIKAIFFLYTMELLKIDKSERELAHHTVHFLCCIFDFKYLFL
jgi:hypothetical protein